MGSLLLLEFHFYLNHEFSLGALRQATTTTHPQGQNGDNTTNLTGLF